MKRHILPSLLSLFCILWQNSPGATQDVLWQTLYDAGEKSAQNGDYTQAERQLQAALEQAQADKNNAKALLLTYQKLAAICMQKGNLSQAEKLYLQALQIHTKAVGGKHPDLAADHAQLAAVYAGMGNADNTRAHFNQAANVAQNCSNTQLAAVTTILNNAAILYENQGKYAASEQLLKESLSLYQSSENQSPGSTPPTANLLDGLARLYGKQCRYAEAEPLLKQALTLRVNALGPINLEVAKSLANLGKIYQDQGNYSQAESLLQRALSVCADSQGTDTAAYASALTDLAKLQQEQHKLTSAQKLYEKALSLQEKNAGPESAAVADILNGLAQGLSEQYNYAAAEPLYRRALKIDEGIYGSTNPVISRDLNNIALLYLEQGRYTDAEPLYKRVFTITRNKLGADHPDVATALNNLAFLYKNQGQYGQAQELLQQALTIREHLFGKEDRLVAQNLSNLASILQAQGKYSEAESLFQRALQIDEQLLGQDHPHVSMILQELAQNYISQQKYEAAERNLKSILERDERILGADKPIIAADLDSLADVLILAGKNSAARTLLERSQAIKSQLSGFTIGSNDARRREQNKPTTPVCDGKVKNKWALIIGISNFKDPSINLKYAAKDANDFRNYLVTDAHFAPEHVMLLTDKDATRQGIIAAMGEKWLKRVADPDDLIVVYVSSHGTPSKKEIGGTNFIVPYEANLDNIVLTGIPMQWLTIGLREMLHCHRLVLIMDLCHSGAAASDGDASPTNKVNPDTNNEIAPATETIAFSPATAAKGLHRLKGVDISKMTLGSGQIVITSSGSDQISWESAHYPNSVFTHQLIQGLQLNGDHTTLGQAYDYMKKQVEEEVLKDRAQIQTPVIMTQQWDENEVILGINPTSTAISSTSKQTMQHPTNSKQIRIPQSPKRGKK